MFAQRCKKNIPQMCEPGDNIWLEPKMPKDAVLMFFNFNQ